ncbi:MAG: radical SAM protein [Deltaproteobacteria bacterium]|nr:radical SAM protein [Deltaproteobacteria bacterium]
MPFRETTAADLASGTVGFGIDVTTNCNLDCVTCYYLDSVPNRPPTAETHLSVQRFEWAMDQAAAVGFREVYLLGGEPTLHPQILEMLASSKCRSFEHVLLVTNGLALADRDFCRRVADSGANVAVQRHAIGDGEGARRVQDVLAGRPDTLTQVNQAFANLEEMFHPARVAVQCCLTRPVVESGQIYDIYRYAKQRGFEYVFECTKASHRFARGNPLDLTPVELTGVYERLQRIETEEYGAGPRALTPQAFGKTCHMPENGVHCLIDGTIVPCVGQPFPLGRIFSPRDTSLAAILDSPERRFFREPSERLYGHCRSCRYLDECTGGCRGDAFFLTGCFSASAVQCPQLTAYARKLSLGDFVPPTCRNCRFEREPHCGPRPDADRALARYLGTLYQDEPAR